MSYSHFITRINHSDPRCQAAILAEKQLFDHYGVDYQVHFVEMDEPNLRLRVLEAGAGRPLLMMPGGSGDAAMYAALMAELPEWRIIAINRPGGGMSDSIDHRQVDLRQLAVKTMKSVADAFDLEQVPIICNSMGGLWSFWYTLAHPERVSCMVQMGCPALALDTSAPFFMRLLGVPIINNFIAPKMQPDTIESALEALHFQGSSQADIDRLPLAFAEGTYHFFNLPTYLDTWKTLVAAVTTLTGATTKYKLRSTALKEVRCPVQFIWGDKDPFGGLDVAHRMIEIMPQARLHEMQVGHLPFLDKPQETGQIIKEFFALAVPNLLTDRTVPFRQKEIETP